MEILTDIANKIGFDWKLSLTHLINFGIIFFLLVRYALPAIKRTIDERNKKIKEGLEMRESAENIVEQARKEGQQITHTAHQKAEEFFSKVEISSKELVTSANQKASEIIQLAEKEKQLAKDKGMKEAEELLLKDLPKILSKVSSQAFSGKLTGELNNEFISKVFKI